jgi:RNA polymerase sigma factor FliA
MSTAATQAALDTACVLTTWHADPVPPRARLDPTVREQLLLEHLPQVRYIARRIHDRLPAQIPFDDLVHAGVLGLMDAVGKFDPTRNVQLKSYAQFRIRGAILDSLREMDWSPRQLRRRARRIEQSRQDLNSRLGRAPTEVELAKEMELGLEEFQHLLGELRGLDLGSLQAESPEGIPLTSPVARSRETRSGIRSHSACIRK